MTILPAALALLAIGSGAFSQDFSSSARGTTGGEFLTLGVGARADALGGAFSAVADDASALYWNPAALTQVDGRSLTLMHAPYLGSTFFDYGAFASKAGPGTLGVGVQYLSAGSLGETDASGNNLGSFTPNDLAVSLGYALPLYGGAIGVSGKYIRSTILATAQTWAGDVGLLSPRLWGGRLRFAATATNLGGGQLKYEQQGSDLPLAYRVGSALRITPSWLCSFDAVFAKNNAPSYALGTEYVEPLGGGISGAVRAGYNTLTMNDVDGFTGASFGLGLLVNGAWIDYAFVPYGSLGVTHRLSLTLNWGKSAGIKTPAEVAALDAKPSIDHGDSYYDLMAKAEKAASAQDLKKAVQLAREAAELEPEHPEVWLAEGHLLYRLHDLSASKDAFEEALRRLPSDDARIGRTDERLGRIAYLRGDCASAKSSFSSAIAFEKDRGSKDTALADAHAGLGLCLEKEGDSAFARKNFQEAEALGVGKELSKELEDRSSAP